MKEKKKFIILAIAVGVIGILIGIVTIITTIVDFSKP